MVYVHIFSCIFKYVHAFSFIPFLHVLICFIYACTFLYFHIFTDLLLGGDSSKLHILIDAWSRIGSIGCGSNFYAVCRYKMSPELQNMDGLQHFCYKKFEMPPPLTPVPTKWLASNPP